MAVVELAGSTDRGVCADCKSCHLDGCAFRSLDRLPVQRVKRELKRGDRLECRAAGGCMQFWIVLDGTAASCTSFEDGRRQILGIENVGDVVCAPMAEIGTETCLEALSGCEICAIDLSDHALMLRDDADFLSAAFRIAHDRLARSQAHLSTLGRLDSRERVALFLAEMAAQSPRSVVSLAMSRQDIADYLGINTETVSRVVTQLRKSGLVKFLSHTDYVVPDMAALSRRLPLELPTHRRGDRQ